MRVRALRDFAYSPDGIHSAYASAGREFDCPEGIVDGLAAEGWVEHLTGPAAVAAEPKDGQGGDETATPQPAPPPPSAGHVDPVAAAKKAEADRAPRQPKPARGRRRVH